jgi:hypothetical protein
MALFLQVVDGERIIVGPWLEASCSSSLADMISTIARAYFEDEGVQLRDPESLSP